MAAESPDLRAGAPGPLARGSPRSPIFISRGQLTGLELRHRRRVRAEDRIRAAKDTGLTNLPLHDFTQSQIWCALVALAGDLTAWMQILALARLLHVNHGAPFTALALQALAALGRLAAVPALAPG